MTVMFTGRRTHARRAIVRLSKLALLAFAGAGRLDAQQSAPRPRLPAETRAALRAEIRRLIDSATVPSVALAVAHDGRVIWEEGFGFADLEGRVPATPSTLYSLTSISKPMTATALMQLVYGLGWAIDNTLGARRVRHTGGMPGVATVLALYPAHQLAIVVLSNQSSGLPGRIAAEIAAALLPSPIGVAMAGRRAAPPRPPVAFMAPPGLPGEWRGTVRSYDGTVPIVLRVDSGEVRVKLGDRGALWTLLNDATMRGQELSGRFVGTIPTEDARRVAHVIALQLDIRDDMMRGWAAASATTETNDYSLSSYAELARFTSVAGTGARP